MFLVVALAAVAAAAVVAYSSWRDVEPARAETATRHAMQLAGVAAVLARAVEGVAEAMSVTRPRPVPARSARLIDVFDDEDEESYR